SGLDSHFRCLIQNIQLQISLRKIQLAKRDVPFITKTGKPAQSVVPFAQRLMVLPLEKMKIPEIVLGSRCNQFHLLLAGKLKCPLVRFLRTSKIVQVIVDVGAILIDYCQSFPVVSLGKDFTCAVVAFQRLLILISAEIEVANISFKLREKDLFAFRDQG